MSAFSWEGKTPEGYLGRQEMKRRRNERSLEERSWGYEKQAQEIFAGNDAAVARDEVARFAQKIDKTEGVEQQQRLVDLVNTLGRRRSSFLDEIPDEEEERIAFGLAMVHLYLRSLQ